MVREDEVEIPYVDRLDDALDSLEELTDEDVDSVWLDVELLDILMLMVLLLDQGGL